MKKIITEFASKIDVINMNNIPMSNTINLMKNKDGLQDKVVDFIRKADLYMDDFRLNNTTTLSWEVQILTDFLKPFRKIIQHG